jgi:uncharacterized membrane protein
MGEMKRANAYEEERRTKDRFASTLVIAASIIAAVRLAREELSRPSPRLTSVIADAEGLARMILEKFCGTGGEKWCVLLFQAEIAMTYDISNSGLKL